MTPEQFALWLKSISEVAPKPHLETVSLKINPTGKPLRFAVPSPTALQMLMMGKKYDT